MILFSQVALTITVTINFGKEQFLLNLRYNFKQMPDYRLYSNTDSAFVNVSPPEKVLFTVPPARSNL